MHPVLARYLDAELVRDIFRRKDAGEDVGAEHAALVEAAAGFPSERRSVTKTAGKRLDASAQQAALFLATHASLRALRASPEHQDAIARAESELRALGAEERDAEALLAQAVADEAFGTDQDPGHFDAAWFKETLAELPRLTALDEERVQALLIAFAGAQPSGARAMAERTARELLESAWSDGASPISVESVEDALDALSEHYEDPEELAQAAGLLAAFVEHLQQAQLVGAPRARKLVSTIRGAAATAAAAAAADDD